MTKIECVFLLVCCSIFVVLCSWNYLKLGYYQDELLHAVQAQKLISKTFYISHVQELASFTVGTISLPLMVLHYVGSLKSYFFVLPFLIVGSSLAVVRSTTIFLGVICIILVYFLLRWSISKFVASLTVVLLLFDPSFIFSSTYDWGPVGVQLLLKLVITFILFVVVLKQDRRLRWFFILGMLCGLLVWDKVIGLWMIFPVLLVLYLDELRTLRREFILNIRIRKELCTYIISMGLGMLPLFVFIYQFPFLSLLFQKVSGTHSDPLTQQNSPQNFVYVLLDGEWKKIEMLFNVLSGIAIPQHIFSSLLIPNLSGVLFAVAFSFLTYKYFYLKHYDHGIYFYIVLICLFFMLMLTPYAWQPHHLLFLWPFPHILLAYVITDLYIKLKYISVFFFGIIIIGNLFVYAQFQSLLNTSSPTIYWSSLEQRTITRKLSDLGQPIIALNWGISLPTSFISKGNVPIRDLEGLYGNHCSIIASFVDRPVYVIYTESVSSFMTRYKDCSKRVSFDQYTEERVGVYSIFRRN